MNLVQELQNGKIIYFLRKDQEMLLVVAEKGGIFKTFPCPINLNNFSNIYRVLCLDYTIYVDYTSRYNVKLLDKNNAILASFSYRDFFTAFARLDKGIELYFEQKGNIIVRR